MLQPLLALALSTGLAGPGQLPADPELPAALQGREITTIVQATHTHFAAWNLTNEIQVLLVGNAELGVLETQPLHPGQRVQHSLHQLRSEELLFEIVRLEDFPPSGTGIATIESLRSSATSAFFVEATPSGTTTWQTGADDVCFARPVTRSWAPGSSTFSLHVPGAPPRPAGGDKPPVVREKPLPPI